MVTFVAISSFLICTVFTLTGEWSTALGWFVATTGWTALAYGYEW